MGAGVLIGAIIGLLILIGSPISYFILKYLGYKKAGIVVALLMASVVLIPFFLFYFESELYSKSDARDDLGKLGIELQDDFEITYSKISGMPEYYQFTELKISKKDRIRIIDSITDSIKQKERNTNQLNFTDSIQISNLNGIEKTFTLFNNYKNRNIYVRDFYSKNPKYIATEITLLVHEFSDTIRIERIED